MSESGVGVTGAGVFWCRIIALAAAATAGCSGGDQPGVGGDSCTATVHCQRQDGRPVCDPGFVRAEPESATDFACVVAPCSDQLRELVTFPARVTREPAGTSTYYVNPALTYTGSELAALWFKATADSRGDVIFATFTPDGGALIPEGQVNDVAVETAGYPVAPALIWSGSGYGAAWSGTRLVAGYHRPHVFFASLDAQGRPKTGSLAISPDFGASGQTDPVDARRPALAWSGSEFVVSWSDQRVKDPRVTGINLVGWSGVYFRRVDERGVARGEQQLTQHVLGDFSVIADATSITGAWGDRDSSGAVGEDTYDVESKTVVLGQAVPPDPGTTIAVPARSSRLLVAAAKSSAGEVRIAAARDASDTSMKLELYRVSAPNRPTQVATATEIQSVVLAAHEDGWLVVWVDDSGAVQISRVDGAGAVTTRSAGALRVTQGARLFAPFIGDQRMFVPVSAHTDFSATTPETVVGMASVCL